MARLTNRQKRREIVSLEESPVSRALFSDVRWSWIWIFVRLYVGLTWLQSGLGKMNNPAWTGNEAGRALTGFIQGALAQTGGENPQVQGWYAWFLENLVLPNAALWGRVVAAGETLVGAALILGMFTGIAAFFAAFMNVNFLLAGAVSLNPILLLLAILLILAWKTAGWWGVDRWLLPALGTPWRPGLIFRDEPRRETPVQDRRTTVT